MNLNHLKLRAYALYREKISVFAHKRLLIACYFFLLILILLPNLIPVPTQFGKVGGGFGAAVVGWLFLIWFAILGRLSFAMLTGLVFLAWWPVEVYLRLNLHTVLNPTLLGMVWDTNFAELKEFANSHIYLLICWGGFLVLLVLGVAWAWSARLAWEGSSRRFVIFTAPVVLALIFEYQPSKALDNQVPDLFQETLPAWLSPWTQLYPFSGLTAYLQLLEEARLRRVLRQSISGFRFNIASLAKQMPKHIVLVLGESSRRDRWSLYGYQRPTTPELQKEKQLIVFSDVVSISNATRSAVPALMSRAPLQRPDGLPSLQPEPSLVQLFKQLGYRTVWLSNQTNSGSEDTPLSFIAADADKRVFLNTADYHHSSTFDGELLPSLQAELSHPGSVMLVLHTLGSHFEYAKRYPNSQRRFATESSKPLTHEHHPYINVSKLAELNQRLEDDYDNSVVYTDQVLTAVLKMVRAAGSSALVVYVSDHGEDLPANGCEHNVRSRYSRYAYEIPVFFWLSPAYLAQSPQLWQQLQEQRHRKMLSTDLFDLITAAAGVVVHPRAEISNHNSLVRKVYTGQRWVDFDEKKVSNACNINS